VKAQYLALFGQDKWKLTDRLTASLGLRYDLEVLPTPVFENAALGVSGGYPVDKNNIQPRVVFAYRLHDLGRSVVRGGYGLFYDKTHHDLGITGLFTAGEFSESFNVAFPANAADSGPRNGLFPTDPFLVNGPTVNRDLLNQLFPPGSRQKNTGTVNVNNPDRVLPYSHQFTIGYERQLAPNLSASADYVRAMARDLLMTRDLNPGLRAQPVPTSPLVREHRDLFTAAVFQLVNEGETNYDALQIGIEKRFSQNWSARAAYTLSYSRGNTATVGAPTSPFQLLDDLNLDLNEGPTSVDRRHNFVVSGTALVPRTHGLSVSWVARALSGLPFTLFDGNTDLDRNGNSGEPLAADTYSGTGADAISVDFESKRNGAYGPGFFQLDLRAGYRIDLGQGRTLDAFGEIFNVTNRANFANPSGNIASASTFLVLSDLREGAIPRTAQIGIRLGF
jgi:hypothetical protein